MEGIDDEHVVSHLYRRCYDDRNLPFDIIHKQGYEQLKRSITAEVKTSNLVAIGIVVDANDSPNDRWKEIAHKLKKEQIDLPKQIAINGLITGKKTRVGVIYHIISCDIFHINPCAFERELSLNRSKTGSDHGGDKGLLGKEKSTS